MRLSIQELGKQYESNFWGLQNFNLDVNSGIVGILGPNGAGKSTLFRMLATVTSPTTGRVIWNDNDVKKDPDNFRQQLGYLPQDFGTYPNLNAIEFLSYMAAAKGIIGKSAKTRITMLLDLVNLSESRKRKLGAMSGGMKQRVGIAQALLNDPHLLIVDEPTAGLDPEERIRFRNLLGELSGDRVVLLSSHIVSDIEAVASSVAVVSRGQLLHHKTPAEMLKLVADKIWEVEVEKEKHEQLKNKIVVSSMIPIDTKVKIRYIGSGTEFSNTTKVSPSLEDAYLFCLNQHNHESQHA